jgi:hypothetical protein
LIGELHGIGYHRSETGPGYENVRHLTDFPLLNVRLMHASRDRVPSDRKGSIRWRPVVDASGQPVEQLRMRPIQRGAEVWWKFTVSLPENRKSAHYGLMIEEIELMVGEKVQDQSEAKHCVDLKFPTCLVERGPLFSHIVDLAY